MHTKSRLPGGFTLVELLIVVAIVGVLAALAAPAFTKLLDRGRLRGAAEQVFSDLQLARTEAIKRNLDVEMTFSTAGPSTTWCYGLRERDPNDPGIDLSTPCDCTEADVTATDACKIDDVLRVTRSSDFRDVSLSHTFTSSRAEFESRQGLADTAGTVTLTIGSDVVRAKVSLLGRVRACTASGMPGFNTADCAS